MASLKIYVFCLCFLFSSLGVVVEVQGRHGHRHHSALETLLAAGIIALLLRKPHKHSYSHGGYGHGGYGHGGFSHHHELAAYGHGMDLMGHGFGLLEPEFKASFGSEPEFKASFGYGQEFKSNFGRIPEFETSLGHEQMLKSSFDHEAFGANSFGHSIGSFGHGIGSFGLGDFDYNGLDSEMYRIPHTPFQGSFDYEL